MALPDAGNPAARSADLLVIACPDPVQRRHAVVWGKLVGRIKVIAEVSAGKTLGGFLGGVATTTLVAWLAAPYLTPLVGSQPIVAGLIIGIGGFVGDVTISAQA